MLTRAPYDALYQGFRWQIPARLNMAAQVCDDWAETDPDRVAIIDLTAERRETSYGALREMADALVLHLEAQGIGRGDRVGVLRSQDAWCAAAHGAIWKLGAVSIPLFKLFQRDALASRVGDAGARLVVTDPGGVDLLAPLEGVGALVPEAVDLPEGECQAAETGPETPAVLIYTSGTTGSPKGALHGHRMLLGHLPGVEMSHDFL